MNMEYRKNPHQGKDSCVFFSWGKGCPVKCCYDYRYWRDWVYDFIHLRKPQMKEYPHQ